MEDTMEDNLPLTGTGHQWASAFPLSKVFPCPRPAGFGAARHCQGAELVAVQSYRKQQRPCFL